MASETPQRGIGARTGLVALLGHPVGHSRSPAMHNAAFRVQQIDAVYLAFDVQTGAVGPAVNGLAVLGAWGANVTIPHKQAVIPYLDRLTSTAKQVGAVNTVVFSPHGSIGHNTDIAGFVAGLHTGWGRGAGGADCLVLGAGGAARAVVAGLQSDGARRISVHNRTERHAHDLCVVGATWGDAPCTTVVDADLGRAVAAADLIVNATAVGMGATVKLSPLPVDRLSSRHVVMDLIYGPEPTALVREARERGAIAIDGGEMLLRQAGLAYELWTGKEPPLDVMRREVVGA
jgi:shikimate dehydrogenase